MNKINKYLLTGIVSLSMTACANLDLNPLSEGSSENWYHDETEIEMALNDLWRPDFFPIDAIYWDDDLLNRNGSNEVTLGTVTSQWGTSSTRWSSLYKSIARATKVIQALDNGSATGISESKVNQYKGEAYFMLGFAYCELTPRSIHFCAASTAVCQSSWKRAKRALKPRAAPLVGRC